MKEKILYIETGMGFGGSAVSLFELISNLRNYEPVVAFFSSHDNDFTTNFKSYNTYFLNARFTYLHKASFYKKLNNLVKNKLLRTIIGKSYTLAAIFDDYLLYRKILRIAKNEKISLLHINNCIHPIPLKAAKNFGVPAVVHLRGHLDCTGNRHNKYNNLFHALIAPTLKIQDFAINRLGVQKGKIKVIYNTVDPKRYDLTQRGIDIRKEYGIDDKTILIGMFARIIPMKGQLQLAKAVDILLSDQHNITCMFIGDISDGDIDYSLTLKRFIKNSTNPNRFIFTGYRDDAPSFYNAIDIAVHGSIGDEAFGRVIIESWAAHKPVVATDIDASVELIEHGLTGLIAPIGNIKTLASEISQLVNNSAERKRLADNGYKRIHESFSSDVVTQSIEDIYSKLL